MSKNRTTNRRATKLVLGACVTALAASAFAAAGTATAELPSGAHRIGVLGGGQLSVKEGDLYAAWVPQMGGVQDFEIDGDRIGVLTTAGDLYVKDGSLYADWVHQLGGVKDFHLAGDRVGVVNTAGDLLVKDGSLWSDWTSQGNDIVDFDMTPTRIGVVTGSGLATVKEGDLYAGWVNQQSGIKNIELAGDRVGVVNTAGDLSVKEGTLYASWTSQGNDIVDFDMTRTRIGVVTGSGLATVKEGDLYAGWLNQLGSAKDIELAGDRLGVLGTNSTLYVKEGSLYASWTEQSSGASQFDLTASDTASSEVTIADLRAIWGTIPNEATVIQGLPGLNVEMRRGGITTPARKAAFLATLRNESGFRYNAVEGGSTATYRGRGYIQLTSQANYSGAGANLGHDFVADPDAAASLQWSAPIARYYWTVARSGSNAAADAYDMGLISRYVGYAASSAEDVERCADFKAALKHFNGGTMPVADSQIVCLRH